VICHAWGFQIAAGGRFQSPISGAGAARFSEVKSPRVIWLLIRTRGSLARAKKLRFAVAPNVKIPFFRGEKRIQVFDRGFSPSGRTFVRARKKKTRQFLTDFLLQTY
jgi:hypothetical protein